MTVDELQRLFDFTESDLDANCAGRLSERQQAALREQGRGAAVDAAATISLIPITLVLVIAYFVLIVPLAYQIGAWTCLVIIIMLGLILLINTLWWKGARVVIRGLMNKPQFEAWLRRRMRRNYADPLAAVEKGVVTARSGRLEQRSDGEHEYLFLGDEELQISVAVEIDERLWKLEQGRDYIVYMVPDTSWIVAVEPGA
jgi:hypothetical protein